MPYDRRTDSSMYEEDDGKYPNQSTPWGSLPHDARMGVMEARNERGRNFPQQVEKSRGKFSAQLESPGVNADGKGKARRALRALDSMEDAGLVKPLDWSMAGTVGRLSGLIKDSASEGREALQYGVRRGLPGHSYYFQHNAAVINPNNPVLSEDHQAAISAAASPGKSPAIERRHAAEVKKVVDPTEDHWFEATGGAAQHAGVEEGRTAARHLSPQQIGLLASAGAAQERKIKEGDLSPDDREIKSSLNISHLGMAHEKATAHAVTIGRDPEGNPYDHLDPSRTPKVLNYAKNIRKASPGEGYDRYSAVKRLAAAGVSPDHPSYTPALEQLQEEHRKETMSPWELDYVGMSDNITHHGGMQGQFRFSIETEDDKFASVLSPDAGAVSDTWMESASTDVPVQGVHSSPPVKDYSPAKRLVDSDMPADNTSYSKDELGITQDDLDGRMISQPEAAHAFMDEAIRRAAQQQPAGHDQFGRVQYMPTMMAQETIWEQLRRQAGAVNVEDIAAYAKDRRVLDQWHADREPEVDAETGETSFNLRTSPGRTSRPGKKQVQDAATRWEENRPRSTPPDTPVPGTEWQPALPKMSRAGKKPEQPEQIALFPEKT